MEERKKTGKSYLWALFAFLLAVAADQFTKWLAVTYLKDQDPLIIIPGVFQFRYLENRGAAFGILQNRQIVFAVGALLIFFAVVFIYGRIPQKRRFVPLRVCADEPGNVSIDQDVYVLRNFHTDLGNSVWRIFWEYCRYCIPEVFRNNDNGAGSLVHSIE